MKSRLETAGNRNSIFFSLFFQCLLICQALPGVQATKQVFQKFNEDQQGATGWPVGHHPKVQGSQDSEQARDKQEQRLKGSKPERCDCSVPDFVGQAETNPHQWKMARGKGGLTNCSRCCVKGSNDSLVENVMLLTVPGSRPISAVGGSARMACRVS